MMLGRARWALHYFAGMGRGLDDEAKARVLADVILPEPTEAMILAGAREAHEWQGNPSLTGMVRAVWLAMADRAKKEASA